MSAIFMPLEKDLTTDPITGSTIIGKRPKGVKLER